MKNDTSQYQSPFQQLVFENDVDSTTINNSFEQEEDFEEDFDESVIQGFDGAYIIPSNEISIYEDYESVEETNRDFESEEFQELEEAFAFGLDKLKDSWQKLRNSRVSPKSLPTVSPKDRPLKLPIVSSFLPDSTNYFKTKNSPERYYGIPETIAALQWIGKEWVKLYPHIKFIIRDISQMGGGRISDHNSHRMGIDVDVRLNVDGKLVQVGREEPRRGKIRRLIPYKRYSEQRKYVKEFVKIVSRNPKLSIKTIGFRDRELIKDFPGIVSDWVGHIKHLHLRFCLPEHRKSELNINKVYNKNEKKPNYECKKRGLKTTTTKPQSINIQDAIKYNTDKKRYSVWAKHLKRIHLFLGYPLWSPNDSQFAKAVAKWQLENGLTKPDGKLGPNTWAKMKKVLGISNKAAGSTTNSSTPVDFQNLGRGKNIPEDINRFRKFRLTTYYVEDQKDYPTGNIKIPIYDKNKNVISFASPKFFAKLSLEGSAKLIDGRLINVTGTRVIVPHNEYSPVLDYHKKAYAKRNRARMANGRKPISTGYSGLVTQNNQVKKALAFYVVPQSKVGVGFGTQRGIKMIPFRTLAADIGHVKYSKVDKRWKGKGGIIPPKTKVYIKEYDGLILPDKSIHDGWFVVNDTGGGIYGAHLDVFVGTKKLRKVMKLPHIGHIWYEGIEKRVPVDYKYGLTK